MRTNNLSMIIARKLAITGALGALTILLGITNLGMIPWFSGASITTLHVPVILATLIAGIGSGIGVGAIFGFYSLIQAGVMPTGPLDGAFTNPAISVLPRLLIAIVTWLIFTQSQRIPFIKKSIACILASFFGSMTNTVLVLSSLVLFKVPGISWNIVWTVAASNGILEAVAAIIICTAVLSAINIVGNKKSRFSNEINSAWIDDTKESNPKQKSESDEKTK